MVHFNLSSDHSFHFELLRSLGHAAYQGSDVNEVLSAAAELQDHPGDFEAFYRVFLALAERVEGFAAASPGNTPSQRISRRDALFRAATYYRAADFYLHGDVDPARINALWAKQTACFDKAIALMSIPGRREMLKANDGSFEIPIIFYAADGSSGAPGPRPTVIAGNGFDGAQEEMLHVCGFAALARGYNVISYEGPGQPSVRRNQGLGFIADWERVVTPIVDWLAANAETLSVDMGRLGLWGHSMGGYLALQAAAFEHRLAAVFSVGGIFSVGEPYLKQLPPQLGELFARGEKAELDAATQRMLDSGRAPTTMKWGVSHGIWAMSDEGAERSTFEFLKAADRMTLKDVVGQIECPVFVGDAEEDLFFAEQQRKLVEALGERATSVMFKEKDGAGGHCQVGAGLLLNQRVFDWFEGVIADGDE